MSQARSIFRAPMAAWRAVGCADASPHSISDLLNKSLSELSPLALPSSWRHKAARHGRWYMASSESHVEYGSTNDRDRLMWLEFQIAPVAICHSPVTVLPARDLDEEPVTAALGYRDPTETLALVFNQQAIDDSPHTMDYLRRAGIKIVPPSLPDIGVVSQVAWLASYRAERFFLDGTTEQLIRQHALTRIRVSALIDQVMVMSRHSEARIHANVYSQAWRRLLEFDPAHHPSSFVAQVAAHA